MPHLSRRTRIIACLTASLATTGAVVGLAAAKPIDDVVLAAGGSAIFDPLSDYSGCTVSGFVGAEDGGFGGTDDQEDAFDGYGALGVGSVDNGFDVPANSGRQRGQTLRVGATAVNGLRVSETLTGLAKAPALRVLVALKNAQGGNKTRDIFWDTDLGSDTGTLVQRSSSGNTAWENADRWLATSDDATSPEDPTIVSVFYGKHAREKVVETEAASELLSDGCETMRFHVSVPGNSTRYMLFFAELHRTNGQAVNAAKKYNRRGLSAALLKGISPAVRRAILNWDL